MATWYTTLRTPPAGRDAHVAQVQLQADAAQDHRRGEVDAAQRVRVDRSFSASTTRDEAGSSNSSSPASRTMVASNSSPAPTCPPTDLSQRPPFSLSAGPPLQQDAPVAVEEQRVHRAHRQARALGLVAGLRPHDTSVGVVDVQELVVRVGSHPRMLPSSLLAIGSRRRPPPSLRHGCRGGLIPARTCASAAWRPPRVTVHYHQGLEAMARQAAALADRASSRATSGATASACGRVQIVLADVEDDPNGFATPLPYPAGRTCARWRPRRRRVRQPRRLAAPGAHPRAGARRSTSSRRAGSFEAGRKVLGRAPSCSRTAPRPRG